MPDTTSDTLTGRPLPPIDQTLLQALTELEKSVNDADAWNLDPQIFLWHPPVLAGIQIPSGSWQRVDGDPAAMFELVADQWADIKLQLIGQDPMVFGQPPQAVVLFTEGWSLPIKEAYDRGDHDKVAEYQRAAERRMMSKHPDRLELRNVSVVDTAGNSVILFRMRGRDLVMDEMSGGMPQAMAAFLRRICAARTL